MAETNGTGTATTAATSADQKPKTDGKGREIIKTPCGGVVVRKPRKK